MNVLIIGLGYAGQRFRQAFEHVTNRAGVSTSIAYVGRRQKATPLRYFACIDSALQHFTPDIVVVSANDISHADVLRQLAGYQGFVVCEKPLATPTDALNGVQDALSGVGGFALNLIERYSGRRRSCVNGLPAMGGNWYVPASIGARIASMTTGPLAELPVKRFMRWICCAGYARLRVRCGRMAFWVSGQTFRYLDLRSSTPCS